jgi:hypothetical protein
MMALSTSLFGIPFPRSRFIRYNKVRGLFGLRDQKKNMTRARCGEILLKEVGGGGDVRKDVDTIGEVGVEEADVRCDEMRMRHEKNI